MINEDAVAYFYIKAKLCPLSLKHSGHCPVLWKYFPLNILNIYSKTVTILLNHVDIFLYYVIFNVSINQQHPTFTI